MIRLGITNVLSRDNKVRFTIEPSSTSGLPSREANSSLEETR